MERTRRGEFAWTDLSAADLDAQTNFYEGLFGWSHTDMPLGPGGGVYRTFKLNGRAVGGASPMQPQVAEQGIPSS
ncbi:MAG TPA: hypothetical protein VIL17_07225 [Coriobacteriia bacterium]